MKRHTLSHMASGLTGHARLLIQITPIVFAWFVSPAIGETVLAMKGSVTPNVPEISVQVQVDSLNAILEEKFRTAKFSKKGADKCLSCHGEGSGSDASGIFHSKHGQLDLAEGPFQKLECETCHGPIGSHARNPRKGKEREPMVTFGLGSPVTAENQNSICLSCHEKNHQQQDWFGSAHQTNDVSCSSCHTTHEKQEPSLNKLAQDDVCTSCHLERKMDEHKRSSHSVGKGQMACSSCHNPHGSLNDGMLVQASVNETCTECHTEKRGPFLFEHAPVVENCTNCHDPHSSNERSLLAQRPPFLCQNCHATHGKIDFNEGQAVNFRYLAGSSCMNCHSKVHGSNSLDHYGFRR